MFQRVMTRARRGKQTVYENNLMMLIMIVYVCVALTHATTHFLREDSVCSVLYHQREV